MNSILFIFEKKKVFKRQFLLAEICVGNYRLCFKSQAHLRKTHLFLNTE